MTATAVRQHRDQMLVHLNNGNVYGFLTMVEPYLRVCPDDAYARLMAAREYLKLGLIAPARDCLPEEAPHGDMADALAALRESLLGIEVKSLPWSEREAVYGGNLEALRLRGINVDEIDRAWQTRSGRYERFVDQQGHIQIRRRDDDGSWSWVPAIRNHDAADQSQALPEGVGGRMPGPFLFDGLGQGGYFERVFQATDNSFLGFSCALFVVEPDPAALAMVMHLRDRREILGHERVLIFTGDDWADRLQSAWEEDADLPFPTQVITSGPPDAQRNQRVIQIVESAMARYEQQIEQTRRQLDERYDARDVRYWANRFESALSGTGEPLRILAAVSTHTTFLQYSMRDARRAFESLGHKCEVLSERTCYNVTSPLRMQRAAIDLNADLFFIIDHLRGEFNDVLPEGLPILTWDQDQLPQVMTRENVAQMAAHDFMVGCSKLPCLKLGADPRQVRNSLVPTCPEQFGGDPLTDDERDRFLCDVSFVSHASQTPEAFHDEERRVYRDPALQKLLDVMFEMMPGVLAAHHAPSGFVTSLVLREGMRRTGVAGLTPELETRLKNWYLWRLGDRIFRHDALAWAAEWARRSDRTLRIYGNGWEQHPTLSEFAAGPAGNGRELLCIYRASRINLQLMPAGFLHQRAVDGLAAGGFFLTRKTLRDVTGRTLRSLHRRIEELGITDGAALNSCGDTVVREGLSLVMGADWMRQMTAEGSDAYQYLKVAGEVPYPDELFPRFGEIVFDSSDTFAAAADRFIDDATLRQSMADEMREMVIGELSYKPMMRRFLTWMSEYLMERRSD